MIKNSRTKINKIKTTLFFYKEIFVTMLHMSCNLCNLPINNIFCICHVELIIELLALVEGRDYGRAEV